MRYTNHIWSPPFLYSELTLFLRILIIINVHPGENLYTSRRPLNKAHFVSVKISGVSKRIGNHQLGTLRSGASVPGTSTVYDSPDSATWNSGTRNSELGTPNSVLVNTPEFIVRYKIALLELSNN